MAIGMIELALVIVVGMTAGLSLFTGKNLWVLPLFGFFLVAAIFSPPDPFSMICIALGSFLVHRITTKRKPRRAVA